MSDSGGDVEQLRAELAASRERAAAAEAELARRGRQLRPGDVLSGDLWFTLAKVVLWLVFGAWVILVLVSFPAYIYIAHDEPPLGHGIDPTLQGVGMALLVDVAYSFPALTAAVGAWGLGRGTRWGFGVALAAGGLSALFCAPAGAVILVALLREPVRRAFFPAPAAATP